jgi:carbonyl reductase 1
VDTPLGAQAGQPPKSVGKCMVSLSQVDVSLTILIEEGARIPLRLAIGDIGQVSGKYWSNDSSASAGYGKIQDW